ncbi:MAG: aminotransferase class III-fold pyridoxal phosphate-dependent enzyme, partial [Pseudomonadales bacterium]
MTAADRPIDLDSYWMPFTANREFKANPRMIRAAEGVHYITVDGRRVLDGLSGLWCCGAGHNRREIADAIADQARELDYAPAFQYGHPKAFELASRVRSLTPDGLDKVFFVNSGSEAADTSLKIARAYWRQRGQPSKTRLIGRAKGYHGVNFGGISVGGIGPNRKLFGTTLETDHLSHTLLPENQFTRGQPEHGAHLADELEALVALHDASNIAAVIVEPLQRCLPPAPGFLESLRTETRAHGVLLVFDEVVTGFRLAYGGAQERYGVTPDLVAYGKALGGGLP